MARSDLATGCHFLFALLVAGASAAAQPPAEPAAKPGRPQGQREQMKPLDPRGRMDDHPTDKPARYYLWHDADGWHLRSCSRLVNKFEGTLRLEQGTFRKLRPIGIDPKGRGADQWGVNKERTELKFVLNTAQSFDGFDFTVEGADAAIEFELLINGKPMPARVFVGRDGEHPRQAKFASPADPEKRDGEPSPGRAGEENQPPASPRANQPVRSTDRARPR